MSGAPEVVPLFATPFGVVTLPGALALNGALGALLTARARPPWAVPDPGLPAATVRSRDDLTEWSEAPVKQLLGEMLSGVTRVAVSISELGAAEFASLLHGSRSVWFTLVGPNGCVPPPLAVGHGGLVDGRVLRVGTPAGASPVGQRRPAVARIPPRRDVHGFRSGGGRIGAVVAVGTAFVLRVAAAATPDQAPPRASSTPRSPARTGLNHGDRPMELHAPNEESMVTVAVTNLECRFGSVHRRTIEAVVRRVVHDELRPPK